MTQHAEAIFAAVESADATSSLIASWRRCALVHGLHPDTLQPPERDTIALREAQTRHARMIALAQPHLDELFAALDDPTSLVCIADKTGLVLEQRTKRTHDVWRRASSDIVGTRYSERDIGTNAVGTAIAEERAINIGVGQSFLSIYMPFAAVAAPIFASNGAIAGALCCGFAKGDGGRDRLALMAVGAFARRIGIEMFAAAFPRARLVQALPDGTWPCALLAVGPDDAVLGATRSARRILGITDGRLAESVSLTDLMGLPDFDDLAGAEARLIAKAMARNGNNRSAVAKTLGISRSTLYRKLQVISSERSVGPTIGHAVPALSSLHEG